MLFDDQLNLTKINKASEKILGIRRGLAIGKHISNLSPEIWEQGLKVNYTRVLRTKRTLHISDLVTSTSTGQLNLELLAFKTETGLGVVMVNQTALKNSIEELNLLMYRLSHDLRSPNTAMMGLINIIRHDIKGIESLDNYLNLMDQQVKKLDLILKNLGRTVRIKNGMEIISRIFFDSYIEKIIKSLSTVSGFKKVVFKKRINLKNDFSCNRIALTAVLQNLFENAIKYRKEGCHDCEVRINVSSENQGVRIIVADNGIGISKSSLGKIFKMFYRGALRATGAGLGLYTVKSSVKVLKGDISVESEEGVGTTFSIYIPNNPG